MSRPTVVQRIVSGGQTGVDRAGLEAALDLGLPCGGWCPQGRRAEDGRIPTRYPLRETPTARYPQRTEWNVRDSDGTLVLTWGPARGGTALTIGLTRRLGRPCCVVDLRSASAVEGAGVGCAAEPLRRMRAWIETHAVRTLNVAGPRESEAPGIGDRARAFLVAALMTNTAPAAHATTR
jgi:hypothetical protein